MADGFTPRFVDLVRNTCTTVGTGNLVVGPAVSGFISFSGAIKPGESFYYSAIGVEKPTEREVGRGTMQPNGTIKRDPIGGELTEFTTGTKTIALIAAAEWYEKVQSAAAPKPAVVTPQMFGAAGDGMTDDTAALQAAFDALTEPDYARSHTLDLSNGEFLVSDTIYACFPVSDGDQPILKVIGGRLRVAPLAALPGGKPLDVVLEIAGPRQHWSGRVEINKSGASEYASAYVDRRFKAGVRARCVSQSQFCDFFIDDAKRDLVFCDSGATDAGGFTVRAGTLLETRYPNGNNIGAKFGRIYGRFFGSTHLSAPSYGTSTPISAKTQGHADGTPFVAETFNAVAVGYGNSLYQRTRLTVGSTADMAVQDLIWTRLELTPSIYGTVQANAAASKIVWSSGDPTAFLAVGDVYPEFQGGENAGREFRVVSFRGTSNREITVTPAPNAHGATADPAYVQFGKASFHTVSAIESATSVVVYPWVPERNNSKAYIVHGAAFRVAGGDTANVSVESVGGLVCPIGYWGHSLYGPEIGSLLCDYVEVGARLSVPGGNHIGFCIRHGHIEAARATLLSHSGNTYGTIDVQSSFELADCIADAPRATTNSQLPNARPLGSIALVSNGQLVESAAQSSNEGSDWEGYAVSNAPRSRELFVHADSATLNVAFDRDYARLFAKHHWARIVWTDDDGSAPDGSLTLNLDPELVALGWKFGGAGSGASFAIAAPSGPVVLELQFLVAAKTVAVCRHGVGSVSSQAGASYTAALSDANEYVRFTSDTATTFTVPPDSAVAFPIGTVIEFEQAGTGVVSVAGGAGVTVNSRGADLSLAGQYAVAALKKVAANSRTLTGDL